MGVRAYLSLTGRRRGGRLFEVVANSRLGAYSNKYGNTILWRGTLGGTQCRNTERKIVKYRVQNRRNTDTAL